MPYKIPLYLCLCFNWWTLALIPTVCYQQQRSSVTVLSSHRLTHMRYVSSLRYVAVDECSTFQNKAKLFSKWLWQFINHSGVNMNCCRFMLCLSLTILMLLDLYLITYLWSCFAFLWLVMRLHLFSKVWAIFIFLP